MTRFKMFLPTTFKPVPGLSTLFHGITMDASPSTIWDNEFWEHFHPNLTEPPVTNADVIAAMNPNTKIIVSMRDPIKRMQSAYQFFCHFNGRGVAAAHCDHPITPLKFHNLCLQAVELFQDCLRSGRGVRSCAYSTQHHQLSTHLFASLYHVYLADFYRAFPKDQIFLVKFEDFIKDPDKYVQIMFDFLEIPRMPDELLRSYIDQHVIKNTIEEEYKLPYLLRETVEMLEEFFKPHIRELVDLLDHDEKWTWDRKSWKKVS